MAYLSPTLVGPASRMNDKTSTWRFHQASGFLNCNGDIDPRFRRISKGRGSKVLSFVKASFISYSDCRLVGVLNSDFLALSQDAVSFAAPAWIAIQPAARIHKSMRPGLRLRQMPRSYPNHKRGNKHRWNSDADSLRTGMMGTLETRPLVT